MVSRGSINVLEKDHHGSGDIELGLDISPILSVIVTFLKVVRNKYLKYPGRRDQVGNYNAECPSCQVARLLVFGLLIISPRNNNYRCSWTGLPMFKHKA